MQEKDNNLWLKKCNCKLYKKYNLEIEKFEIRSFSYSYDLETKKFIKHLDRFVEEDFIKIPLCWNVLIMRNDVLRFNQEEITESEIEHELVYRKNNFHYLVLDDEDLEKTLNDCYLCGSSNYDET